MSERNFRVKPPKNNRIHSSNNPPPKKDSEKKPSGPLMDTIANVRKESEQEWKDRLEHEIDDIFRRIQNRILEEAKDLTCTSYIFNEDAIHRMSGVIYGVMNELFEYGIKTVVLEVNGKAINNDMIIKGLRTRLVDSGLKVSCKWNKEVISGRGKLLSEMKISWD